MGFCSQIVLIMIPLIFSLLENMSISMHFLSFSGPYYSNLPSNQPKIVVRVMKKKRVSLDSKSSPTSEHGGPLMSFKHSRLFSNLGSTKSGDNELSGQGSGAENSCRRGYVRYVMLARCASLLPSAYTCRIYTYIWEKSFPFANWK